MQLAFFNDVSENFVFTIRKLLFKKLLNKDVAYFDCPENKPGHLSVKLSKDSSVIRVLVSTYLGSILQALASFLIGVIFGFVYSWRITLLVIGLSPALFMSGVLESILYYGKGVKSATEDQNMVQESFNNIKVWDITCWSWRDLSELDLGVTGPKFSTQSIEYAYLSRYLSLYSLNRLIYVLIFKWCTFENGKMEKWKMKKWKMENSKNQILSARQN